MPRSFRSRVIGWLLSLFQCLHYISISILTVFVWLAELPTCRDFITRMSSTVACGSPNMKVQTYIFQSHLQSWQHALIDDKVCIIEIFNNEVVAFGVELDDDGFDGGIALDEYTFYDVRMRWWKYLGIGKLPTSDSSRHCGCGCGVGGRRSELAAGGVCPQRHFLR